MPQKPRILAIAGSKRTGSFNVSLLRLAVREAEAAGAEVTVLDLKDYPLPIMDQDIEAAEGVPENARKIKALMKSHQAFLIASPEYNSSITPLLKNVIDWASRREEGERPLECFAGKVAAIVSASPGALGGLRSLFALRQLLSNINMLVIPDQLALMGADKAFDEQGELKDENQRKRLGGIAKRLVEVTAKLNA